MNLESNAKALSDFFKAMKALRRENILTNKKDFTCQIGEWLVEVIYGGKRASSAIQKGWDVVVGGKNIQVKTHAKAQGNNNRWTRIDKESSERIDELMIVVFTDDYKLKEFYKIPWQDAVCHIKPRGKKKSQYELNWSSVKSFQVDIENLPRQDIISLFK